MNRYLYNEKDISGCGLSGIINRKGIRISGEAICESIRSQHDRGNGLGGGFAAYGIYPEFKDLYTLHIMYDDSRSVAETEEFLIKYAVVEHKEYIPTRAVSTIKDPPIFKRYFIKPAPNICDDKNLEYSQLVGDDFVVHLTMYINTHIHGAFVVSSGKNMGAFKGVGYPEEIADFFKLEEYSGYIWTAHNRFPTNTPGWWGGAHPFTLLDWSIVHNGEISSYGTNMRYLEMFGYKCTMRTDTEVVTYLLDLLIRKHGLSIKTACWALAPPFWNEIERMDGKQQALMTAIRYVYGSGLLNGPFAILFAHNKGLVGLNDRIKLRPLVVAEKDDFVYMASEESAIRVICPEPEKIWSPPAGQPVIIEMKKSLI